MVSVFILAFLTVLARFAEMMVVGVVAELVNLVILVLMDNV
jgi:hypothetical protein